MPVTQVQRKLEFPVKKRVTRQSKKNAGKQNAENNPVTHPMSPRKRHGEGIVHFRNRKGGCGEPGVMILIQSLGLNFKLRL